MPCHPYRATPVYRWRDALYDVLAVAVSAAIITACLVWVWVALS